MIRTRLRKAVEQFPWLADTYRNARDQRQRKNLTIRSTSYGISILGGGHLAAGVAQESAEISIIEKHLSNIDLLIDVGANSGIYTCLAASRGKHVVAIEPSQDNIAVLFENLRLNHVTERVEVYPVAIADNIGALPLYGRGQGASLIHGWGDQRHRAHLVPVNTIDNIIGDRFSGEKIFLKMDVEGVEFRALSGAQRTLARCSEALIEISLTRNHPGGQNPNFLQTFQLLWDLGYKAYSVDDGAMLVTSEIVRQWLGQRHTNQHTENFWFTRTGDH